MKKIVCLMMALSLMLLASCGPAASDPTPTPDAGNPTQSVGSDPTPTPEQGGQQTPVPVTNAGPTALNFASEVTALEGDWVLSKVYTGDNEADAAADAMFLKITLELDPSELVDDAAYIHNQVYNMTGHLTFGQEDIVSTLAADDVEEYKGSTGWQDFPKGEVVKDGEFYKQPGPATMSFRDIDEYGLFLDQIAGISGDVDTTAKKLIIGMNADGQLLLGYSEEHLEREGTKGEWVYCLVFDKAN